MGEVGRRLVSDRRSHAARKEEENEGYGQGGPHTSRLVRQASLKVWRRRVMNGCHVVIPLEHKLVFETRFVN